MKRMRPVLMTIAGGALLSIAQTSEAAGFIKFDGVDGEFTRAGETGWIEVYSYSFAVPPPAAPSAPAPAGVATGGPGSLSIVKKGDKASPQLMKASAQGTIFPIVRVEVPKTSQGPQVYLKYELKNVMITSIQTTGGGAGGGVPTEQVSFNYTKIEYKYAEQKGTVKKPPAAAYSLSGAAAAPTSTPRPRQ